MEKFLLKDHLFNKAKINILSRNIKKAYPSFNIRSFEHKVFKDFNSLELKERIQRIAKCLELHLPSDFDKSTKIILKALPPPCDPSKSDDDFGDFIYEPFNLFVARNGCEKKKLNTAFKTLEQLTQRFSAEYAIREFLINYEKETIKQIKTWTKHKHYHVRRLCSEGIRPNLPWGKRVELDLRVVIDILDKLYLDKTRYVTRSVANNLNDISKKNPKLVIATLKRWEKENKQSKQELEFIKKHSLRTLIKSGNKDALEYLGFVGGDNWKIKKITYSKNVKIGKNFIFDCELEFGKGNYIVDYTIYFASKDSRLRPKVFKAKKHLATKKERLKVSKSHAFKEMTTRKIYPGMHCFEFQINGGKSKKYYFEVSN